MSYIQSQGLFGYGNIIAQLLVQPSQKSTENYRYSVTYLTGNERAGDALTKYIRKRKMFFMIFLHFQLNLVLERNPHDQQAQQCLGIIHEFNKRFIQAAHAYQS